MVYENMKAARKLYSTDALYPKPFLMQHKHQKGGDYTCRFSGGSQSVGRISENFEMESIDKRSRTRSVRGERERRRNQKCTWFKEALAGKPDSYEMSK